MPYLKSLEFLDFKKCITYEFTETKIKYFMVLVLFSKKKIVVLQMLKIFTKKTFWTKTSQILILLIITLIFQIENVFFFFCFHSLFIDLKTLKSNNLKIIRDRGLLESFNNFKTYLKSYKKYD